MKTKKELIEWFCNLILPDQLSLYEGSAKLGVDSHSDLKKRISRNYPNN